MGRAEVFCPACEFPVRIGPRTRIGAPPARTGERVTSLIVCKAIGNTERRCWKADFDLGPIRCRHLAPCRDDQVRPDHHRQALLNAAESWGMGP